MEQKYKDLKLGERGAIIGILGVKRVKEIRARKYDNNPVVDVIILVNSKIDIRLPMISQWK